MTNFDLSLKVFDFLTQAQVRTIVVCAGARNAPIVIALEQKNFKVYSFFEERSAAFFALGLSRTQKVPVAILTTSGTAVAELLPAAIEATYQGLPLILITADRPKSYRGSGAPQSIEQVGIFSKYVEATYDLDIHSENFHFNWSMKKPIHLNICFDEPLLDQASNTASLKPVLLNIERKSARPSKPQVGLKPFILIGGLHENEIAPTISLIQKLKAPVYAESISQLRHVESLAPFILGASDAIVKKAFEAKHCDSVIRVGNIPTLRFWRDLENDFKYIPVTHITGMNFTGLSRVTNLHSFADSELIENREQMNVGQDLKNWDQTMQKEKEALILKYPKSEPALVALLSNRIAHQPIYLGNSLPIRHWDQFSEKGSGGIYANRGANGIDGQVSTYLGWSEGFEESYCLVGDLTAMYDLVSLGLTNQLSAGKKRIVVLNNFGGQIFNRVLKNDIFVNPHLIQFKAWASMWNWTYSLVKEKADLKNLESDHAIIEIQPSEEQTKNFWSDWDLICQKA